MRHTTLLIIALALHMVTFELASGGGHERHGGNIVICENGENSKTTVELLDFFLAKETMVGWRFDSPGNDYEEIARLALQKLRPVSGKYVDYLNQQLSALLAQTRFIDRSMIRHIDDVASQVIPTRNCVQKQIAVQTKDPLPGEARLLIDQMLWNQLDDGNRAGLLIHELLLMDEMATALTHTDGVMYIVAQLFSDFFETAPFPERIRALSLLKSSHLTYSWKGLEFKIDSLLSLDDSGLVRQGHLKHGGDFHLKEMIFGMTCDIKMPVKVNRSAQLEACFLTYSTPEKQSQIQLRGIRGQSILVSAYKAYDYSFLGPGPYFKGISTTFHASGIPTSLRVRAQDAFQLGFTECGTWEGSDSGGCWIQIDENGSVISARLWDRVGHYPKDYAYPRPKKSIFEGCFFANPLSWVELCDR